MPSSYCAIKFSIFFFATSDNKTQAARASVLDDRETKLDFSQDSIFRTFEDSSAIGAKIPVC